MVREPEAKGSDGGGGVLGVSKFGWRSNRNLLTPSPPPPLSDLSASASLNIYRKRRTPAGKHEAFRGDRFNVVSNVTTMRIGL
eukprot:gene26490-biopygen16648